MYDVSVIGGGIFGCLTAITLAKQGYKVILFEKNSTLMVGSTLNNQSRLHLGYHYPRDKETALQCIKGFTEFKNSFSDCIIDNFHNLYYISNVDSSINFSEFKTFCLSTNLPFNIIDLDFNVKNVEGGIYTDEVCYDAKILKQLILKKLKKNNIKIYTSVFIENILKYENYYKLQFKNDSIKAKSVVNSTYSNYNMFNDQLKISSKKFQFELVIIPIIRWDHKPIGITIMDGPFFSFLPLREENKFSLYHVKHSVIDTITDYLPPNSWNNFKKSDIKIIVKNQFDKMIRDSYHWFPEILKFEIVDYRISPRIIISNSNDTDKRISIIDSMYDKSFINIFSGKIDHSIWMSDSVSKLLMENLN